VSEAEDRDDVAWLAANASPEALQALGQVADKDPAAQKALSERATSNNDVNVYLAAWAAVLRNAPWGTVIHAIVRAPDGIYVGGEFGAVDGVMRVGLAAFADGSAPPARAHSPHARPDAPPSRAAERDAAR